MTNIPRQAVALSDPSITATHILSAANNNATVIKSSPGTLQGLIAINTTSVVYYLKLYDKATTPAPATDTVVMCIPIPHGTDAGGGVVALPAPGLAFSAGIGIALVGAIGDTDNTNAATGVAINVLFS